MRSRVGRRKNIIFVGGGKNDILYNIPTSNNVDYIRLNHKRDPICVPHMAEPKFVVGPLPRPQRASQAKPSRAALPDVAGELHPSRPLLKAKNVQLLCPAMTMIPTLLSTCTLGTLGRYIHEIPHTFDVHLPGRCRAGISWCPSSLYFPNIISSSSTSLD